MTQYQKTLARSAVLNGTGLHTGKPCRLTVKPAPVNHGISFIRTDICADIPPIPATWESVVDLSRGTTLGINDIRVQTIEHVMASLHAFRINNALIEMNGPEPPVGDGSAKPYTDLLEKAGTKEQKALAPELVITSPVTYADTRDNVIIKVFSSDTFRVTFLVDYPDHLTMGTRFYTLESMDRFEDDIAPARTYGLLSEMKSILQRGLGKGGSLDNNLVFIDRKIPPEEFDELKRLFHVDHDIRTGNSGILDERPLRFSNEPVRHKILDLVGDLYLLGMPLRGHVMAFRSGHKANVSFVKKLAKEYQPAISGLQQPEPVAGLLGSLIPELGPVPAGWKIRKGAESVHALYTPLDLREEKPDKGLVFRLLGLSAASSLLYENVRSIQSLSLSETADLKFYKDFQRENYTFLSRISNINGNNATVSVRMLSPRKEIMCEAVVTLKIERYA